MSIPQWHRILALMSLFLVLAWSVLGLAPDSVLATSEMIDYFPPPTPNEIAAKLNHVSPPKPARPGLILGDESVSEVGPTP